MIALGTDIVEVERIKKAAQSEHFLTRVFAAGELEYFRAKGDDWRSLAGMWCVKEAVAKALGTGVVFALTDIELTHEKSGKPVALLHGKAKSLLGNRSVEVSVSHTDAYAAATAIIM